MAGGPITRAMSEAQWLRCLGWEEQLHQSQKWMRINDHLDRVFGADNCGYVVGGHYSNVGIYTAANNHTGEVDPDAETDVDDNADDDDAEREQPWPPPPVTY